MRTGVAIVGPVNEGELLEWDFVLSHWEVHDIYLIGDIKADSKPFKRAVRLPATSSLPRDAQLVCMAPKNGRYLEGKTPLSSFKHPEDAIYVFGSNHEHLIPQLKYDHRVYIPTTSHHEMFSYVAAAITLYDRNRRLG